MSDSDLVCHSQFKACLDAALAADSQPFGSECPIETVVATMKSGMDLASAFSGMFKQGSSGGGARGGRAAGRSRARSKDL